MGDVFVLHVFEAVTGARDALFEVTYIAVDAFDPGGDLAELAVFHFLDGRNFLVLLEANFFDTLLVRQEAFGRCALDLFGLLQEFGDSVRHNDELFGDFVDHFVDLRAKVIDAEQAALLFADEQFAVGNELLVLGGLAAELLFFDLDFFEDFTQFCAPGVFSGLEGIEAREHVAVALVGFTYEGKERAYLLFALVEAIDETCDGDAVCFAGFGEFLDLGLHVTNWAYAFVDFDQGAGEFFAQAGDFAPKAFDCLIEFLGIAGKLIVELGDFAFGFADVLDRELVLLGLITEHAAELVDLVLQMGHLRLAGVAAPFFGEFLADVWI